MTAFIHAPQLDLGRELVVDLFAGGGGASLGLSRAYRSPDIAVNHDPIAVGVHAVNHPETVHYTCDVFEVDPVVATGGRPVGVLWASPDCRHHSKAKGGKPRSKRIRGLAWVVVRWAAACKPRVIMLENVEEFADWGPLQADGRPCKLRRGITFRRWVRQLELLGYVVEHRELIAADHDAPTIRKRLYVVARCDGRPIVWPKPVRSKKGDTLPRWRAAAECIDWNDLGRSIFDRARPLAQKTCRRLARGVWRHTLTAAEPFVVPITHSSAGGSGTPGSSPLRTITTSRGGEFAVAMPMVAPLRGTSASHTSTHEVTEPLSTVTGGGTHHALAAPVLVGVGGRAGQSEPRPLSAAYHTTTAKADTALVAAHIVKFRGDSLGHAADSPAPTITAGGDMVRPAGAAHALGLLSAALVPFGQNAAGASPADPLQTVLAGATRHTVMCAHLEQANGGFYDGCGRSAAAPASTVLGSGSHQQLVTACLVKYYGAGGADQAQTLKDPLHTATAKARMAVVEVVSVPAGILSPEQLDGARRVAAFMAEHLPEHIPAGVDVILLGDYALVDLLLRMLKPRELARAQGFPDSYVLEYTIDGKRVTQTDQVRLIGNSVCPDVAEALARENLADLIRLYAGAVAA